MHAGCHGWAPRFVVPSVSTSKTPCSPLGLLKSAFLHPTCTASQFHQRTRTAVSRVRLLMPSFLIALFPGSPAKPRPTCGNCSLPVVRKAGLCFYALERSNPSFIHRLNTYSAHKRLQPTDIDMPRMCLWCA